MSGNTSENSDVDLPSSKESEPSVKAKSPGLHIKDSRPSVPTDAGRPSYNLPRVPDTQKSLDSPDIVKSKVIEAPYRIDPKPIRTQFNDEVRRYGLPNLPKIPGIPEWVPYAAIAVASVSSLTYAVKFISKFLLSFLKKKTVSEELAEYYDQQYSAKVQTLDEILENMKVNSRSPQPTITEDFIE